MLLYDDIQRQCGGAPPPADAKPASPVTGGARCHPDGSRVTLSGRITYRTVAPDPDEGLPGHHYALLTLDRPVCLLDGGFGAEPRGRAVAIVPEGSRSFLRAGAHVTLTGTLTHRSSGDEPPQALQFDVP